MKKYLVVLSGGLDSSTNLFLAHQEGAVAMALTFDYGQRAVAKEIQAAKNLCAHLNVPHQVIQVPWLKGLGNSSLTHSDQKIPKGNDVQIDSHEQSIETMKSVWVPNRNGILLNIAAGFAESLGADAIVPGFNLEEASTFPDNSEDYMESLNKAFVFSTRNHVKVQCWTVRMDKTHIMKKALELKMPLKMIWPCYFAEEKWCGECESCQRTKRAMKMQHLKLDEYFLNPA